MGQARSIIEPRRDRPGRPLLDRSAVRPADLAHGREAGPHHNEVLIDGRCTTLTGCTDFVETWSNPAISTIGRNRTTRPKTDARTASGGSASRTVQQPSAAAPREGAPCPENQRRM